MFDWKQPSTFPQAVSSLLPPQAESSQDLLPTPLALLGPLPPTTPIHLALNHLYLASLPEFESGLCPAHTHSDPVKKNKRDRVLVITGPKEEYAGTVEEEDEDWIRERGGDYDVLDRLKRVDMRYCPTIGHVMLLLSLLTQGTRGNDDGIGPQYVEIRPSLVILWHIGSLLMETKEANENERGDTSMEGLRESRMRFKRDVVISDYLEIVAAAKSAVDHLSSLAPRSPATSLMILEPEIPPDSSLPIFPPNSTASETVPKQSREKRIKVLLGLGRILGQGHTGSIVPAHIDYASAVYTLSIAGGEGYSIRRRRCPRGTWGSASRAEVDVEGLPVADGDPGGWRWEWT